MLDPASSSLPRTRAPSGFTAAEAAFVEGRYDDTIAALDRLAGSIGQSARAWHLRAVANRRLGRPAEAEDAFLAAGKRAPANAAIANDYGNLLASVDRPADALRLYDRALINDPRHPDAAFNRVLALQQLGRHGEALEQLASLPRDARTNVARGASLLAQQNIQAAEAAFQSALAQEPARSTALRGRARVALERGDPNSAGYFREALRCEPGRAELVLGLAESLEADSDAGGRALLRDTLARHPSWVDGQSMLARMLAEAGVPDFAAGFAAARGARPSDEALCLGHIDALLAGRAYRPALAVVRQARARWGDRRGLLLREAALLHELAEYAAVVSMLDGPANAGDPAAAGARARACLAGGDVVAATPLLEAAVAVEPGRIENWAHLELAWRAIGDPRHAWLAGPPGFVAATHLPMSSEQIEGLATVLRTLHRTRAAPPGQSLRRGTQTRGRLFWRKEAEIARLLPLLVKSVADYVSALPPLDRRHPLLTHRNADLGIAGSWSARLAAGGYHVAHTHSQGVISSALHLVAEGSNGNDQLRAGWLELGRPPANYQLAVEPIVTLPPLPGQLVLFPSYLFHGTRPNADGERLTIAFDIMPAGA